MLYTGKGDDGSTYFYGSNTRSSKAGPLPEALGALDECNSYIGLIRSETPKETTIPNDKKALCLQDVLHDIQNTLFIVQAQLAGADKKVTKAKIKKIEEITDTIEKEIPPIKNFILPGGTTLSAMLDVARTLARKAERRVVGVEENNIQKVSKKTLAYLNRLSSVLFAIARYIEHLENVARDNPTYS